MQSHPLVLKMRIYWEIAPVEKKTLSIQNTEIDLDMIYIVKIYHLSHNTHQLLPISYVLIILLGTLHKFSFILHNC